MIGSQVNNDPRIAILIDLRDSGWSRTLDELFHEVHIIFVDEVTFTRPLTRQFGESNAISDFEVSRVGHDSKPAGGLDVVKVPQLVIDPGVIEH